MKSTRAASMPALAVAMAAPPAAGLATLPDYLAPGLRLVSVGLNPSLPSVRAGFYFANPRNRFWRALNASALLLAPVTPAPGVEQTLLRLERIGFTDVVKRPTRGAQALRAADFRRDAPRLEAKLAACSPQCVWFHGKLAYQRFLRHTQHETRPVDWGEQALCVAGARVFVTPNPSPANAVFSLAQLIDWYDRLAAYCEAVMRTDPGAARHHAQT